ncbi:ictacalcin-like [Silurus meridionalis]|uniref:ictacalcin-like n=1 Tax=Silurus meridionalis TaxID=175797 RepID=UPI001EEC455B|nr:ictacalcin-like [Silurus meridionalis]KAI5105853.1 ictacalcin [Silurus meridionalis]
MSDLKKGMCLVITTFHKYASKEGDPQFLSKGELKDLLTTELGPVFENCNDQAQLNKIFNDLDNNKDGKVDFQEYVTLVACITMLCNEGCQGKKK